MYTLDRSPAAATDRLPVTLLRAGAEPLELPNAAELARRHGERWIVVDGTSAQAVVRTLAAPCVIWLARRGRVLLSMSEGAFPLDAGQFFVTEAGDRVEVSNAGGRDSAFVAIIPPARLTGRIYTRLTGNEPVAPTLFLQHGAASGLLDAFELDRVDRALVVPASEWTLADLGEAMLARLVERQRELEPAIERTSGRTRRHKRHLFARLNRVQVLVQRGPVRDYSMRELADVAALSVWHFVRMYGQVFGETPHRFLTRIRLERAAALLATSDASIATVAERLGFENRCAFARLFRSHFGIPASVHRREARLAAARANVSLHVANDAVIASRRLAALDAEAQVATPR